MKKSEFKKIIKECISEVLNESLKNHLGERVYNDFSSWKRACKNISPNCKFDGNRDICQCLSSDGKGVGEWDGSTGTIYNKISEDAPCWKDYEQIGTKEKNGKTVPNCVPKK